jgi:hypothetical protein
LAVLRPAPQARLVDHVVVQQGGGVDELDHRGELVARAALGPEGIGGQEDERGAQALAAARDDVVGDRPDQDDLGIEAAADAPRRPP